MRGLAVTTLKRSSAMPDLPAISESLPGYDASTWGGILAPAGTLPRSRCPASIHPSTTRSRCPTSARVSPAPASRSVGTPEAFAEVIRNEVEKWGRIVKEAGIPPE